MPGVDYMTPFDLMSAREQPAVFTGARAAQALTHASSLVPALDPDLNPRVGQLAQRLLLSAGRSGAEFDGESWALIEEMLAFAAEAEQQIGQQKKRIHHLESLSITDELTGLANLRGFRRLLKKAIASARRHQEYGVIGYIDLDGFKAVNDTFGHAAGDAILCQVAEILKSKIRVSDLAARIGGDEFAIVLDRAGWGRGARRLVDIQSAINAMSVEIGGAGAAVQASMGLAPFGPSTNINEVLGHADEAMFADKRARNLRRQEKIAI